MSDPIQVVNLEQKFALFDDLWSPKIAGELNESHIKLAKIKGEFVWHQHENEDEMFLVVQGTLRIKVRGQDDLVLGPGEFAVIPKGVEHCPVAEDEVQIVMLEPKGTLNTGNVQNEHTQEELEWI